MHGALNVHTTLTIFYHIDRYYHAATGDMVKCLYIHCIYYGETPGHDFHCIYYTTYAIDYFG